MLNALAQDGQALHGKAKLNFNYSFTQQMLGETGLSRCGETSTDEHGTRVNMAYEVPTPHAPETESNWLLRSYVTEGDFETQILLPPSPGCWDYSCTPPTTPGLCSAGDQTRGFLHARQAPHP